MISKLMITGACITLVCLILITASVFWDTFKYEIKDMRRKSERENGSCYYDCYVNCTIVDNADEK